MRDLQVGRFFVRFIKCPECNRTIAQPNFHREIPKHVCVKPKDSES